MREYENQELRDLKEENHKLHCVINELNYKFEEQIKNEQCCAISMDYEEAYYKLQHEFQELANENKDLKQALVNIALKL